MGPKGANMKILVLGAGVIGTTYAWQLSTVGHEVSLLVRTSKREPVERDGIRIRYRDERLKKSEPVEVVYRPAAVDQMNPQDAYDLIIVSVRAHQMDEILPELAAGSGSADILFFGNNWWGEERIRKLLPPEQYLFGFSRLVGGWRTENQIECIFFDNPELVTMLGERDGQLTPRLKNLRDVFEKANLKPMLSPDILGWLSIHYVEFLGVVGGIRKAGSYDAFVASSELIKDSILATRESLEVCRARGVDFKKAAPSNIRIIENTPVFLLAPLVKMQYRTPSIKQFFEENIDHGMDEISRQYCDVTSEARRLEVKIPHLAEFERYFRLN
jgi:ketopantoate reductase